MEKSIISCLGGKISTGIVKKVATGVILGAITLGNLGCQSASTTNRRDYPLINIYPDPWSSGYIERKVSGDHGMIFYQVWPPED